MLGVPHSVELRLEVRALNQEYLRRGTRAAMLVIHGVYRWGRKLVAYRNDYCLSCAAPRLAFQHRTFDVLHAFWIPLIPIGLWKRPTTGRSIPTGSVP